MGKLSAEAVANPVGVKNGIQYNYAGFKTTSTPCSCSVCSHRKYNRAKVKRYGDYQSAKTPHRTDIEIGRHKFAS